jgi:hypothetical protein
MPVRRRDIDPKKQPVPTTRIDPDGTRDFTLADGTACAGLGFRSTKSVRKIRRNSAEPIQRNPLWTRYEVARRVGMLTAKAMRSLVRAGNVFVINEEAVIGTEDRILHLTLEQRRK